VWFHKRGLQREKEVTCEGGVRARIHHFTQTTPKKKTVHRRNSMNVCIYNIAIRKRRRPPFEKEHERERASVLHGNGMEWSKRQNDSSRQKGHLDFLQNARPHAYKN